MPCPGKTGGFPKAAYSSFMFSRTSTSTYSLGFPQNEFPLAPKIGCAGKPELEAQPHTSQQDIKSQWIRKKKKRKRNLCFYFQVGLAVALMGEGFAGNAVDNLPVRDSVS
jgi:hypothetical protein